MGRPVRFAAPEWCAALGHVRLPSTGHNATGQRTRRNVMENMITEAP